VQYANHGILQQNASCGSKECMFHQWSGFKVVVLVMVQAEMQVGVLCAHEASHGIVQ
jgi:hypothetical protein